MAGDLVEITDFPDWSAPIQFRIHGGQVEIRQCWLGGGMSGAYYVGDKDQTAEYFVRLCCDPV